MKERPILFSGEMVKAILGGRKTQTRRVVKPQPFQNDILCRDAAAPSGYSLVHDSHDDRLLTCPYGVPGDRLWVKETWCQKYDDGLPLYDVHGNGDPSCCYYRATETEHIIKDDGNGGTEYRMDGTEASPWQPSIFMPRWASRITLEIVSVRVERLREITEDDVVAEGIEFPCEEPETGEHPVGCVCEYRNLWDRINGKKHPWSSNPWVWRIEFKRKGCRQ